MQKNSIVLDRFDGVDSDRWTSQLSYESFVTSAPRPRLLQRRLRFVQRGFVRLGGRRLVVALPVSAPFQPTSAWPKITKPPANDWSS